MEHEAGDGTEAEDVQLGAHRQTLLERASSISEALRQTEYLRWALTTSRWEEGRAVIESIAPGNENPVFPKLFLFFLREPERISTVEALLEQVAGLVKPLQLREVIRRLEDAPEGTFGELGVFAAVSRHGLTVELFPQISSTGRVADLAIQLGQKRICAEVTVLTEGTFWANVDRKMLASPTGIWTGSGPGPEQEGIRVARKIAEELAQVAPGQPNALIVLFSGVFPSKFGALRGFNLALEGDLEMQLGDGKLLDFRNRLHLDCVIQIRRTAVEAVYLSPERLAASALTDKEREQLGRALHRLPLSFP